MTTAALDRATLLLQVAAAAAFGAFLATMAVGLRMTFDAPLVSSTFAVFVVAGCVVGVWFVVGNAGGVAPERPQAFAHVPEPPVQPMPVQPVPYAPPPSPPRDEIPWWEQAARGGARRSPADPAVTPPAAPVAVTPRPAAAPIPRPVEIVVGERDAEAPATRQIVQCPRCGAFDVHVSRERKGCAFACHACGNPWQWRAGAPWPVTVVRPAYRHHPTEPADSESPPVWRLNP